MQTDSPYVNLLVKYDDNNNIFHMLDELTESNKVLEKSDKLSYHYRMTGMAQYEANFMLKNDQRIWAVRMQIVRHVFSI